MKPQQTRRRTRAITQERFYPHSPERVWLALTDPRELAQWLLPNTFQPRLGHRFRFTQRTPEGKSRKVDCQVVELEAPSRLAYTWQTEDEALPTLVTWTLEAVVDGTCLRLEHTGPETSSVAPGETLVNRLDARLQSGEVSSAGHRQIVSGCTQRSLPTGRILLPSLGQPLRCVSRSLRRSQLSRPGRQEIIR
ncbi:MAG: hypothetical protein JWN14_1050 [Chthonomonadales bacterium]|nr:hypothetical protein [Chthonomonadales bacterium]